ncbi:hypothetical protein OR1_02839 [Geobacter sp. OR-1]|nr:hypothetical protein OR1_02839 [Geobacter sp. OR-1]
MLKDNRQLLISIMALLLLTGTFAAYFDPGYIGRNGTQLLRMLFSFNFLYFVVAGIAMVKWKLAERRFNLLVFAAAFIYLLIFYSGYLDLFRMEGDNICQVAYWEILFRPNLAASIGAAFTKPGQVVVLGLLYKLSLIMGGFVFKGGICLVMALCIWCLVRIATDLGGRMAGAVAFPVAATAFLIEFLAASNSIFLIPSLYIGIWLYLVRKEHKPLGRFLLVLSVHFHIYAIAVLLVVWLVLFFRKEWRELIVFSAWALISMVLWAAVLYRVQGAFDRFSSGPGAGYVGPLEGMPDSKLDYMINIVRTGLAENSMTRLLFALVAIGVFGACYYGAVSYLGVFSILIILVLNVVFMGGTFNLERYCAPFYAFGCSLGIGTIIRLVAELKRQGQVAGRGAATALLLMLAISFGYALPDYSPYSNTANAQVLPVKDFIVSANKLLSDDALATATRLMTEDDFVYPIVIQAPDRFTSLTALQYFNVSSELKRRELLAKTDYILLAMNDSHPYYYLTHLLVPEWDNDPFRLMIHDIIRNGRERFLYGFSFAPVAINPEYLIVKVEPGESPGR